MTWRTRRGHLLPNNVQQARAADRLPLRNLAHRARNLGVPSDSHSDDTHARATKRGTTALRCASAEGGAVFAMGGLSLCLGAGIVSALFLHTAERHPIRERKPRL